MVNGMEDPDASGSGALEVLGFAGSSESAGRGVGLGIFGCFPNIAIRATRSNVPTGTQWR